MSTTALPRPIDPFAGSRDGRYEDDAVVVLRVPALDRSAQPGRAGGDRWATLTEHFAVGRDGARLVVAHALRPGDVDNDLAVILEAELFAPGWAGGADTFERLLTGVVLSCHDDALTAWEAFYRATLRRLGELCAQPASPADASTPDGPEGALAGFAPVYRRAEELVHDATTRTLLDLGTCFGFFPLRLAAAATGSLPGAPRPEGPLSVRAGDISPGSCDLLSRVSTRLGTPVPVLVCDAACVPVPDADVDTVTLLHVLEHVPAAHGEAILAEAVRLAGRRVIVGVPLESEADAAFGHVRTISLADLRTWGATAAAGGPWRAQVEEHHGGWLVLDRLLPVSRRH